MFRANIKKKTSRKTVFFFFLRFMWIVKKISVYAGEKKNVFFAAYACSGKVSTEFKPL